MNILDIMFGIKKKKRSSSRRKQQKLGYLLKHWLRIRYCLNRIFNILTKLLTVKYRRLFVVVVVVQLMILMKRSPRGGCSAPGCGFWEAPEKQDIFTHDQSK